MHHHVTRIVSISVISLALLLAAACSPAQTTTAPDAAAATATRVPGAAAEPTQVPAPAKPLPQIIGVALDRSELPRYESLEMELSVDAQYANPFDARQVSLDGVFTAPDGSEMKVPGFWDGKEDWRMRFTPSQAGEWRYRLVITDGNGASLPAEGTFLVTPSDLHGWLQVGSQVDAAYSSRYLAYQDGTPFYGIGHCDPLNILADGFHIERGVGLFDNMVAAGENYVVWWPLYSNSPINSSYDRYSVSNLNIIDLVVRDAQKKGIFLIFTIWDHPELRALGHAWGGGRWESANGFRSLGSIDEFFTSDEAWAWQENFYRYIIARWGYSPAIGMWQLVSEVNGTNAYAQTDAWHSKMNAFFVKNDPYRHPTTASMSGDVDWPAGFQTSDAPQVHIYALEEGAVKSADVLAYWTGLMWRQAEKPNWVGEFGVSGNLEYPELFHNSIWAALASGAALTPAEWNDRGQWGQMTPEMIADLQRLGLFVADIPLVKLNPVPLQISANDAQVRAWGVAGADGGLFWVQDFALEGQPIQEVRQYNVLRSGVQVELLGLAGGDYSIYPFDTSLGAYLPAFEVTCVDRAACPVPLPDFKLDMAFRLERK